MTMTETANPTPTFTPIIPRYFKWREATTPQLREMANAVLASEFHQDKLVPPLKKELQAAVNGSHAELVSALNTVYKFEDLVAKYKPEIFTDWLNGLSVKERARARSFAQAINNGRVSSGDEELDIEVYVGLTDDDTEVVRTALSYAPHFQPTPAGRAAMDQLDAERAESRAAEQARFEAIRLEEDGFRKEIMHVLTQDGRGDYTQWFSDRMPANRQKQLRRLETLPADTLRGLLTVLENLEPSLHATQSVSQARREEAAEARRAESEAKGPKPAPQPQAPTWEEKHARIKVGKPNPQGVPGQAAVRGKPVAGTAKTKKRK